MGIGDRTYVSCVTSDDVVSCVRWSP
jgi:hypothetical protein